MAWFQTAWMLCADGRRWQASVEYGVGYEWDHGKHLGGAPARPVAATGELEG